MTHVLVVYDSTYGHTEKVAQAIGEAIGGRVLWVSDVKPEDVQGLDLLIAGSPTHGGRPTPEIDAFTKSLPATEGPRAAAFDTRTAGWSWIFGYAAPRIARRLESRGAKLVAPPEGFIVLGTRGPLKEGELARAAEWAKRIAGE
jgi:flavodoxin I